MKRKQRGKRQKGCSVWKVLQESQIGNRRRKRQNEGERERRGEEFWPGRKWSTEGGIEVWRGFLLVALSPDWCLLFSPLPLFTVLPAQLLSGLGSELQWDWNNACVTFVFITLSYMHKNTHTVRVTDGHFFPLHCSFGSVRPSVSVGPMIKQISPSHSFLLPLLSECVRVFARQQCVLGLLTSATCDPQGMKNLSSTVLSVLKCNSYF